MRPGPTSMVRTTRILIRRGSQSPVWRASSARTVVGTRRLSSSTEGSRSPFLNGLNDKAPENAQHSPIPFHSTLSPQKRYAVLVDAENASLDSMKLVLREIRETFRADTIVRRVYGDFSHESSHKMHLWQQFCKDHAFVPVHAFTYVQGKNSSDTALIIDSMELLFINENIDGFCIVSSDSDFTRLALRLREAGKNVIGFGHQGRTAEPFSAACEKFIFVNDLLRQEHDRLEQEALAKAKQEEEASRLAHEMKENPQREGETAAAPQVKAEEKKDEEEVTEAKDGFLKRLLSKISIFFHKSVKANDGNMAANNDTAGVQSSCTYGTVSREDLDSLHAKCKQYCDAQGRVRLDLVNQGEKSRCKLVDYEQYGYEKLLFLILDHPNEFEILSDNSIPPMIRSLKNADVYDDDGGTESQNEDGAEKDSVLTVKQLKRLHDVVNSCKDETGWATLSQVASLSKLQISNLGYTKFSKLVKDMPSEFQLKIKGSTSHMKSVRN